MGAIIVGRTSLEYGHVQRGGPGPRGGLSAPADGAWQRSEVGVSWEPVPVHGAWQRPWTFIAAVAATVIGLGNVWKFSWLAGQHGGGDRKSVVEGNSGGRGRCRLGVTVAHAA